MSKLISKNCIVFDIDAAEKKDVISALVKELDAAGKITDQNEFFEDVLAREAIAPTYVGFDMGLPHGKTDHVLEASVAFARTVRRRDRRDGRLNHSDCRSAFRSGRYPYEDSCQSLKAADA